MPLGVGLAPAGVSVAGFGQVDAAPVPPKTLLVDTYNGQQDNARRIDPYTKGYVMDAQGRIAGMNGVQQLVYLAVATVRNSSALNNFGNPAGSVRKIGTNVVSQLQDAYRLALKDLTDRKLISIDDITVTSPKLGAEMVNVRWRDLTTGLEQVTTL